MVVHTNNQTKGQIVHIHGECAQCACVFVDGVCVFALIFSTLIHLAKSLTIIKSCVVYPAENPISHFSVKPRKKRARKRQAKRRKKCSISSISVEISMSLLKSPYCIKNCVYACESSIHCTHSSSHKLLNVSGSYMFFIKISFIRILLNRFDVGDKIYIRCTLHTLHTACTQIKTVRSKWQVRRRERYTH